MTSWKQKKMFFSIIINLRTGEKMCGSTKTEKTKRSHVSRENGAVEEIFITLGEEKPNGMERTRK